MAKPLFNLGQTVMTRGIEDLMLLGALNPAPLLARHRIGDWGDLEPEDKARNDRAVTTGERIMSAYTLEGALTGEKVWIVTEADRSVTTILLPSEY